LRKITLFFMSLFFLFVASAYANFLGDIAGKVFEGGIETLVGIVVSGTFVLLGLFCKKALNWRTATKEGVSVVMAVYKGTRPGSPGGARLTQAELDVIIADTTHFGAAFGEAWAASKVAPSPGK
jgi:hypothetical protein